ncbi:MAG: hypothetical protein BWY76_02180 [bacterium ADurb.Bin429]|nr:MAG: hypothetical protein BWY76_02180 [bacterium ADurb.Bin429]
MYRIPCYRVALVRESTHASPVKTITSPQHAYELLRDQLEDRDREVVIAIFLNTRNAAIGIHTVSIGSLNSALLHPRETFRAAILAGAAAIILGHCHPSGTPDHSREDIAISVRLKEVGELIGIPLIDHIVVGDGQFVSLRERGVL